MKVTSQQVSAAIGGAKICLHELTQAASELSSGITSTGIGQEDEHYVQLLLIVNKCVTALEVPQANLKKNIEILETILTVVQKKEGHTIVGGN